MRFALIALAASLSLAACTDTPTASLTFLVHDAEECMSLYAARIEKTLNGSEVITAMIPCHVGADWDYEPDVLAVREVCYAAAVVESASNGCEIEDFTGIPCTPGPTQRPRKVGPSTCFTTDDLADGPVHATLEAPKGWYEPSF